MRKASLPMQRVAGSEGLLTITVSFIWPTSLRSVAIGEGRISAQSVVQKIVALLGGLEGPWRTLLRRRVPPMTLHR